ncbi:MAG: hypothetical protein ACE37H_02185, partial [Phycisphaeraceae bacterium]
MCVLNYLKPDGACKERPPPRDQLFLARGDRPASRYQPPVQRNAPPGDAFPTQVGPDECLGVLADLFGFVGVVEQVQDAL